jgi:hypothetical protein
MALTDEQAEEALKQYLAFAEGEARRTFTEERAALDKLVRSYQLNYEDKGQFVNYLRKSFTKTTTQDAFHYDVAMTSMTSRRVTQQEQADFATKLGPLVSRILRKGTVMVYGSVILGLLGMFEMPQARNEEERKRLKPPVGKLRPEIKVVALPTEQAQIDQTFAEFGIQCHARRVHETKVCECRFYVNGVEVVVNFDSWPKCVIKGSYFSHLRFAYDGQWLFGYGDFPLKRETKVNYHATQYDVAYWREMGYVTLDSDGNTFDDAVRQKTEDDRKQAIWDWEHRPCEDWRGCKRETCPCKRPSYLWFSG